MSVAGINTLHGWSSFFALTPRTTGSNKAKHKYFEDQIKSGCFISLITLGMVYNWYGKLTFYGEQIHKSVTVTISLMEVLETILNLLSIYRLNFYSGPRLNKFVYNLQKLEIWVDKKRIENKNKQFLLEWYFFLVSTAVFCLLSAYVHMKYYGWDIYKYIMVRELQNLYIIIFIQIVTRYPELIGIRMQELNFQLWNIISNGAVQFYQTSKGKRKDTPTITKISASYTSITELIDEYNDLVGPLCVVFCGVMVLNIMVPLNMALLFVQDIPINLKHPVGIPFLVFSLLWVAFPFTIGIRLFTVCDQTEKETRKVSKLCYQLIQIVGTSDYKLRHDLEDYANQADRLKPTISAAGYFDINNTLTMPLFGSIFTYLIVLMQFQNIE